MDMLMPLMSLPTVKAPPGYSVRRAQSFEKTIVIDAITAWFGEHSRAWPDECELAYARQPIACQVALREQTLIGFACYDATFRGFLGPIGVSPSARGAGIGGALLSATLHAMRAHGYGYAIIGNVGAADFFSKFGAHEIPNSTPGAYAPTATFTQD
ncbi:MAG: GNAT family N-acetyltransferase [Pseudomonadota bacterium]